LQQHLMQHHRVVVGLVMGAIDQGDDAPGGQRPDAIQIRRLLRQFSAVAALEFRPFRRVMAEPLPQLGGGRDLLHPVAQVRAILADAAGPQAIDQNPRSVRRLGRFIGPLQAKVRGGEGVRVRH